MPKAASKGKEPKATRSRSGCLTCRQRKIKCDEQFKNRSCGNCTRLKRTCLTGTHISFRNEQNPSFQKDPAKLSNFYAYRNTFHPDTHWQHVPPIVDFVQVEAWKITGDEGNEYLPGEEQILSRLARDDSVLGQPVAQPGQVYDAKLHALSEAAVANQQRSVYYQDQPFQPAYQAATPQPLPPQSIQQQQERAQNDANHIDPSQQQAQPHHGPYALDSSHNHASHEQQIPNQQDPSGMSDFDIGLAASEAYTNLDYMLRDAAEAAVASSHIDPNLEGFTGHIPNQMNHQTLNMDESDDLARFLGHDESHGGGGGG